MISVYTYIILCLIFQKALRNNIIFFTLVAVLGVRVIFPFYHYSKYWEIPFKADSISAIALFLLFISFKIFNSHIRVTETKYYAPELAKIKNFSILYFCALFLAISIFVAPAIISSKTFPMIMALNGDYVGAHNTRVFLSKETDFGVLIDLSLKLLFPILAILAGTFKALRLKILNVNPTIIAVLLFVTAFLYFQKAAPLQILIMYFLATKIKAEIRFRDLIILLSITLLIIFLMSGLYLDGAGGTLKFQDLIFRRIGKTPTMVYLAYIEYGELFGPEFLAHSFIFSKSANNPALPMLIYQFMEYGDSASGWANGYFVGDLYVNFGYFGVVFGSVFIGYILSLTKKIELGGGKFVLNSCTWAFGILLAISLPGNSFFAFSIFIFLILFLMFFPIKNYILKFGTYRIG